MTPPRQWAWMIALSMLIGVILRWRHIGAQSLWFDEGYSAWMAGHGVREILRLNSADTAPPLYYLLLHCWILLFGDTEAALRSLSACASCLAMLAVALAAVEMFGLVAAAACVSALAAISPMGIFFAQEARGYAMMQLSGAVSALVLVCYLQRGRRRWLVLLAAAQLFGLYLHNIMLLYAVALAVAALVLPGTLPPARRARQLLITAGAVLAGYLPCLPLLKKQTQLVGGGFWISRPTLHDCVHAAEQLCGLAEPWTVSQFFTALHIQLPFDIGAIAMSTGFACAIVLTFAAALTSARHGAGWVTLAWLPYVISVEVSRVATPILIAKSLIASTPPALIIFGLGASSSVKLPRWIRVATGGAMALLLIFTAVSLCAMKLTSEKEDWRGAAALVASLPPASRLIVLEANDAQPAFDYYYLRDCAPGTIAPRTGLPRGFFDTDPPHTLMRVRTDADLNGLREFLARGDFDQVVLVLSHGDWADPDGLSQKMFEPYPLVRSKSFHDVAVRCFAIR